MKYFGFIILILLVSCNKEENSTICEKDGINYISLGTKMIDNCYGGLLVFDKVDNAFSYSFLIVKDTMKHDDYNISNYKGSDEFIRLNIQADSLLYDDPFRLTGSYSLIDTNLNVICYADSDGKLKTEQIIDGTLSLGSSCPHTHMLHMVFKGQSTSFGEITAESYIQSKQYSYKLTREVKGEFIYNDMDLELSYSYRDDGYEDRTRIKLGDYTGDHTSELIFDILLKSDNLTGQYLCGVSDSESLFAGSFWLMDSNTGISIDEDIIGGELSIDQNGLEYNIDYNLITRDSISLNGNWVGKMD